MSIPTLLLFQSGIAAKRVVVYRPKVELIAQLADYSLTPRTPKGADFRFPDVICKGNLE